MGKFLGWLAGIVAAVIGGYAVWYFTTPHLTTIEGMVYTDSGPVTNAKVEITLTGVSGANQLGLDFTDEHGAYRIDFSGVPRSAGALLQVTATGYESIQPRRLASPLPADTREYLPVIPIVAVSTPAQPGAPGQPGTRPNPAAIANMRMPAFLPKTAARAARFKVVP